MVKTIVIHRISSLIHKEILQIFRDPSSLLIAFILPAIFLVLCGYGMSLDIQNIKFGIVTEDTSPVAQSLVRSFTNSKYYTTQIGHVTTEFADKLTAGKIKGFLVIPQNFSKKLINQSEIIPIQLITDGSDPNTARLIQNYTQGVLQDWLIQTAHIKPSNKLPTLINIESRIWFNTELKSANTIVPGVIVIVMALVGTLLTSLVIAREWEHGTMESLMTTPTTIFEIIVGKVIPYFILGMFAMFLTVFASIIMFNLPFKGSFIWLIILSSAFMLNSLFLGLLISTIAKNQFVASIISLVSAFLPTVMLSGFLFEISSMPYPIRLISHLVPGRYFISGLRSLFLVGDLPELFVLNTLKMLLLTLIIFFITTKIIVKRLD